MDSDTGSGINFGILRTAKLSTKGSISSSGLHNFREQETKNADALRTHLNIHHGVKNASELLTAVNRRLATQHHVRKNAVLALEYFFGASPDWFKTASEKEREAYFDDAERWLVARHGAENVVGVSRHYDETSPHAVGYAVPIDPKGKLNCSHFQDGRKKLAMMQTDFANVVCAKHGLERGIEGSTAEHTDVEDFYKVVNAKTPKVKTVVPVVREPTFAERIAEAAGGETDHSRLQAKADKAKIKLDAEIAAQRKAEQAKARMFDLQVSANKSRDKALTELRANSVRLRNLDLELVLEQLGYQRRDKRNWQTEMGRLTVDGTKFYLHGSGAGGGGAIDLVMLLYGADFNCAVKILSEHFGADAVVADELVRVKAKVESAAAAPALPFALPEAKSEHWPRVRDYLTQVRQISADLVDRLHDAGKIYADKYRNCVFKLRDSAGVELRGTNLDHPFHGFRGKKTGFYVKSAGTSKQIALVESSIDALSLIDMGFDGNVVALGGNNPGLAGQILSQGKTKGYEVLAAFDRDAAGDAMAAAVPGAVRMRPVGKDWNADLLRLSVANGVPVVPPVVPVVLPVKRVADSIDHPSMG